MAASATRPFAPHLPRSSADQNDMLFVSNSRFLRKAAQITAMQAKPPSRHRYYFATAEGSKLQSRWISALVVGLVFGPVAVITAPGVDVVSAGEPSTTL